MKTKLKNLLSVTLACAMLFTLLSASAFAESSQITEVFSAQQFSNAGINEFLKVFPRLAGCFDALGSTPPDSPAYLEVDSNGFSLSGNFYCYLNGDNGTATFEEYFHANGIDVYPQTLGAYLAQNGFGEIASALLAADGWSDFDTGEGPAFDFDWGLDGIGGLAQKYAAFTGVIGTLIDAAKPLFTAALGTQDLYLSFDGDTPVLSIVCPSLHMEYPLIKKDLTNVVYSDITGNVVFASQSLYSGFLLPLYRALGMGTVIDYTFAGWDQNADAEALAALLFDPLYALVSVVQNDPATRAALISFYGSGCEERVAQIGSGGTNLWSKITISDAAVDFEVSGSMGSIAAIRNALNQALVFLICNSDAVDFQFDAEIFIDVAGVKDHLNAMLPALTNTGSEHATEPTTEPETEPATEPATEENDGGFAGFWVRFMNTLRGFIDWVLRLFHKP
ncbi:MAG: hypothetical protein K6G90_07905 [Clostridia bacterium]|nr:hypothetical protein [Clostridia bacterium]